ncbi:MAG: DUF6491 family protein [Pseudomonadota bacterium]
MKLKWKAAVAAMLAAGGCASAVEPEEVSQEVAERLAEFEATGETRSCIGVTQIRTIDALDESRFLVRAGGAYYLNEVSGRCNGADRAFNRLQYTTSIGQLCRNEIIRIVDNSNGFTVGSCSLGDFQELEEIATE